MLLKKGESIEREVLEKIPFSLWKEISLVRDEATEEKIGTLIANYERKKEIIEAFFEEKISKLEGRR